MFRVTFLKEFFLFSISLPLWLFSVKAQDGPVTILNPEVAAFTKYGNFPVSTYTGTANVSVPLFTIQEGDIDLPITLNYNTSGIKVQEEATWTGLGWSLNTGGQITRVVRGLDDFIFMPGDYNYLSTDAINDKPLFSDGTFGGIDQAYLDPANPNGPFPTGGGGFVALYLQTKNGQINLDDPNFNPYAYDFVSDMYFFTAGGSSGKFVFDDSGNPLCLKKNNLKIARVNGTSFQITDSKGVIYSYTLMDRNSSVLITAPDVITTWYLTSIATADGNNSVVYKYAGGRSQSNTITTTKAIVSPNGSITPSTLSNYNSDAYSYPTEIDFREGKIMFYSSGNRTDLTGVQQLDSLVEFDNKNHRVKKYAFDYSYFQSTKYATSDGPLYNTRLKLDSIVINDSAGVSYSFAYNTDNIPSKESGVDHWGYFNNAGYGIPSGIMEMPVVTAGSYAFIYQQYNGGDYEAHWPYTESMILQKITYPTKGYTRFEYEPNQFGNVPAYWEYALPPPTPNNVVLTYPVASISLTPPSVPVTGTLDGVYNLYCHFYCNDPTDLYNIIITLETTSGAIVLQQNLANFTHSQYNDDYYLNVNNLSLSGNLVCQVVDSRPNRSVSAANFFQFWQLSLTAVSTVGQTSLVNLNVPQVTGGGLRIHRVVNSDGNIETSSKQYQYTNDDGTTSGIIMNYPIYLDFPMFTTHTIGVYAYLSSTSVIGLSTSAAGSYIGYSHVIETEGDPVANIGTTEYDYISFPDTKPSQYGIGLPCLQTVENGLLLKKAQYDINHNEVAETDNTYSNFNINWNSATGVIFIQYPTNPTNNVNVSLPPIYFWKDYQLDYQLLTTVNSLYGGNSGVVSKTTQYTYGTNENPQRVTVTTSKNEQAQVEYRYADDFTSTAVPEFVLEMQNYNILDKPIETVSSKVVGTNDLAIGGTVNIFGTGNTRGLINSTYSLDLSSPLTWGAANFSNALSGYSFSFNTNYALKDGLGYAAGNIINYQNRQQSNSYVWEYNGSYPAASCVGASSGDIAATSFEADGTGNWTTGGTSPLAGGITGNQYYSLNNDISRSGLNTSTKYVVSYWSSNGAYGVPGTISGYPIKGKTITVGGVAWTYYEHVVTGQSTVQINGGGGIDELRLYPEGAEMTTFTYAPLVGMTSQCDVANRITYYFYDGMGRLNYVKDQDGNIVKSYLYHYKGQ